MTDPTNTLPIPCQSGMLSPCPFCGTPNPVIIKDGHWPIEIHCTNWECMAMIVGEEIEYTIRHWNRRVKE